jgi:hypothetical protein
VDQQHGGRTPKKCDQDNLLSFLMKHS